MKADRRTRPSGPAALALVAALTLAGCSAAAPTPGGPASGASGQPSAVSGVSGSAASQPAAAPSATGDPLAQAERLAASYDYDGALALLAGQQGDAARQLSEKITADKAKTVAYATPEKTSHIFYHMLVVDPKRAFSDPKMGQGWAQYFVTKYEFERQLQQMYDRGFVLVHPERLYSYADGKMTKAQPIMLPEGKKPLVLSADDINYYSAQEKGGFATALKLNAEGRLVNEYPDASGKILEGAYDIPTVLDEFVAKNPGFSYRGDKGTLAITGYDGTLGFRSSIKKHGDTPKTRQAIADATKVADRLKATGWQFACHSWNHISYNASTLEQMKRDMKLWKDEVEPILGKTDRMIYAYGAEISDATPYSRANPKFAWLKDEGFNYFFLIDTTGPYWSQLGEDWWRQARINVDGFTIQRALDAVGKGGRTASPSPTGKASASASASATPKKPVLDYFFDTASTVDPLRPLPVPSQKNGVE